MLQHGIGRRRARKEQIPAISIPCVKRNHRGRLGHEYQGTSLRLLNCKVFLKAENTCITPFQTVIETHLHVYKYIKVALQKFSQMEYNLVKPKSGTSGYHWF